MSKACSVQKKIADGRTDRQTSEVVDMPPMKLDYAMHFHTVSKYDKQ